ASLTRLNFHPSDPGMMNSQAQNPVASRVVHSINYLELGDRGQVVLAGSHGGLYSGYKAVRTGVRAVVLNDAGVGLEDAGIAALGSAELFGLPVATVDSRSARIGDGADMLVRGVISHANAPTSATGVVPGMRCSE